MTNEVATLEVPEWSIAADSILKSEPGSRQLSASPSSASLLTNTSTCNNKPKILLMGLSKAGKTSIRNVIFHKMSANETQFLDPTHKIDKIDISNKSFLDFQLWDFPGKLDISHLRDKEDTNTIEKIFVEARVLIFVIDPVEEKHSIAIDRLHGTILEAYKINPKIKFEVFIHKSDSINEDQKHDNIREMTHRINRKLMVAGLQDRILISFRSTSIYDHSIFEAMSIVCQQLLENILSPFENILNAFVSSNQMEKAFIFDLHPKIFIATDSSTFDMPTYELCCDMLDLIADMGCIYQEYEGGEERGVFSTCSVIKLNDTLLHLKQINRHLALVCIQMQQEHACTQGIVDYNFQQLKHGIQEVLKVANL